MTAALTTRVIPLFAIALLAACSTEQAEGPSSPSYHFFGHSEWSEPVNLGATVNSAAQEGSPTLSPDGLSLYFQSNRMGGVGGNDLWVSRRVCDDCAWGAPVNLAVINTTANENGAELSNDGHLLFFQSNRPGSQLLDIWMSRRADPKDDLGWELPVNLGPDVKTAAQETGPEYLQNAEPGAPNLYFARGPNTEFQDIYLASVTRDGAVRGPVVLVAELSDPTVNDASPALRGDGREIFFNSSRVGTLGLSDLWVSTRRSLHDPWSTPVNPGAPLNTADDDNAPSLSLDGRTLVFTSTRPGGLGRQDIWMATRTPSGH